MKTALPIVALGLIVSLVCGCAPNDSELAGEKGTLPQFLTAADFEEIAEDSTGLCESGSAAVRFDSEGDVYGYPFSARAGDVVSFETEGEPGLDTVLALFGPEDAAGYYGQLPVAMDDDGGEGLLSRVDGHVLKDGGDFILVVATYGGLGRGDVTLTVRVNDREGCDVPAGPDEVCCFPPDTYGGGGLSLLGRDVCDMLDGRVIEACAEAPTEDADLACCALTVDETAPADLRVLELLICERWGGEAGAPIGCEEPFDPGEPVCCLPPDAYVGGVAAVRTYAECRLLPGEPTPPEWCDEPADPVTPVGELVCCVRSTTDGDVERFHALAAACTAAGGEAEPGGTCADLPLADAAECCLFALDDWTIQAWLQPSWRLCRLGGGTVPGGTETCGDTPAADPFVCCVRPVVDEGREILEHARVAGESCPADEWRLVSPAWCSVEPPVPACCAQLDDHGAATHLWLTTDTACLAAHGEPRPPAACDTP